MEQQTSSRAVKVVHNVLWPCNHGNHMLIYRGMMMTACDLAAITKPWEIQLKVTDVIV